MPYYPQPLTVKKAGTAVGTEPAVNFIEGTNVTITVTDDPTNNEVDVQIAASGGGGGTTPSDFQPAIVTGNYYTSPSVGAALTTSTYSTAGVLDNILAYPIWFSHAETWTRIGTVIDTESGTPGAVVRFGIWENSAGNVPGDLIVDSGALSLEVGTEIEATISVALSANTLYWIGALANDGDAALPVASASKFPFVAGSPSGYDIYSNGYIKSQSYGALPDPFGTPDSTDGAGAGNVPMIWLRKV